MFSCTLPGVPKEPKKLTAQCSKCGRRTSVRRDGTLHAHYDPGWRQRCPETKPLVTTVRQDPNAVPLWKGNMP